MGVFGLIASWNFPIAIPAYKAAPALAFGNTVVPKPATATPTIAHALAVILHEAGAPPSVFNMVLGEDGVSRVIVGHLDVDGVSFTGSQTVGGNVAASVIARQARVQLEMGGKNPLVVLDDADLDLAIACAIDDAFFSTGQRCTASSRIIVRINGEDALRIANLGQFGLSAGIITASLKHARHFCRAIRAGKVMVDRPPPASTTMPPSGGPASRAKSPANRGSPRSNSTPRPRPPMSPVTHDRSVAA